jgi:predicted regulator of Ras-like GTPase activity (Roadblock/LC7/MglB family)
MMAFEAVLKELRSAGATAAAIVSRDGTVLGADLPSTVSRETFSIMCATIHGAGMTVSTELHRSNPSRIVLETGEGRLVIAEAGRRALVVLVLPPGAEVEHVMTTTAPVLERIARDTG